MPDPGEQLAELGTARLVELVDERVPEPHAGVDQDRPVRVVDEEPVHGHRPTEVGGRMVGGKLHGGEVEPFDPGQLGEGHRPHPAANPPRVLDGRRRVHRLGCWNEGHDLAVIPVLIYEDIEAGQDYLVRVFGFTSDGVERTPDGAVVHGEVRWVRPDLVAPSERRPGVARSLSQLNGGLVVHVEDVDAHFARTPGRRRGHRP